MNTELFAWMAGLNLTITGALYLMGIHDDKGLVGWIVISIGTGLLAASVGMF